MKTSITLIAIALVGALAASPAAQAQSVGEDSVTGSGTGNLYSFALDAHSGPSGENPSGTAGFWITGDLDFGVRGPVTCLVVQGKRAVIGIANDPGGTTDRGTLFEVTDNPDTFTFRTLVAPPADCSGPVTNPPFPVETGDITIIDGHQFPTSKDQCKNGGWRNFGSTFRNQGQCVAFVERGPKP
jgi:hypothetical protein